MFHDILRDLMITIGCGVKELACASGLSPAVISRYRTGRRTPQDTNTVLLLSESLSRLAADRGMTAMTTESIYQELLASLPGLNLDIARILPNLNRLIRTLSVNLSSLARDMNYDASTISRILRGERRPGNPQFFLSRVTQVLSDRFITTENLPLLLEQLGIPQESAVNRQHLPAVLMQWLLHSDQLPPDPLKDSLTIFLQSLDRFDLNEYIKNIRFDSNSFPGSSAPLQGSKQKTYSGLKEMMNCELDFLRYVIVSDASDPLILYSDMPMEEMAKDPEFAKNWMMGMALTIKKGLVLEMIHNTNRPLPEMILGLMVWIPLYMTGQIRPHYIDAPGDTPFTHILRSAGTVAMGGFAVNGHHKEGRYWLTTVPEETEWYRKQATLLLRRASVLMEIYHKDRQQDLQRFLLEEAELSGTWHFLLSSPPIGTISRELLSEILHRRQTASSETERILEFRDRQELMLRQLASGSKLRVDITPFSPDCPPSIMMSSLFPDQEIAYRREEWNQHMEESLSWFSAYPQAEIHLSSSQTFHNIQILIRKGDFVLVSKEKAPAIHYVIRHPRMVRAFEEL